MATHMHMNRKNSNVMVTLYLDVCFCITLLLYFPCRNQMKIYAFPSPRRPSPMPRAKPSLVHCTMPL